MLTIAPNYLPFFLLVNCHSLGLSSYCKCFVFTSTIPANADDVGYHVYDWGRYNAASSRL